MGLLNTTIVCGLILTKFVSNSPLKLFPQRSFLSSLTFSDFKLSQFTNTALFFQLQSNILIKNSHFSRFLKTPIIESRPPITDYNRKCYKSRFPIESLEINDDTFQICSTDFEADMDLVNSSGGALYFDNREKIVQITQCNFCYCHAGINGGAIFVANADTLNINFTYFQDCTTGFLANRTGVKEAKGGAIFANCLGSRIIGCYFIRCTINYSIEVKKYGGAIYFARCTPVSPQRLRVYLSNFDDCGTLPAQLGVDYGGAIYINATNSSDYFINISYTNFTNCAYYVNGSIIGVDGDPTIIYFMHTGFILHDRDLNIPNRPNYTILNVKNNQKNVQGKLFLYNISLYEYPERHTNFIFNADNCIIGNTGNDLGSIYLTLDNKLATYFNDEPINSLKNVNLYSYGDYQYPFIEAFYDHQVFKPFATPMETPTATRSLSPAATPNENQPIVPTPSSSINPPQPIGPTPSQSDNSAADGSNSSDGSTKKGGLSTAAIVLIVLACIIVFIVIIVIVVLCVRNGSCGNSRNQIFDARTVENDESIRRFTYF